MSSRPLPRHREIVLGALLVGLSAAHACDPTAAPARKSPDPKVAAEVERLVQEGLRRAGGGDPAGGIAAFEEAYALDPTHLEVTRTLAAAHRQNQRLARAVEVATSGLAAHPGDAELLLERGRAREAMADFSEAESDYRKVADGAAAGSPAHRRLAAVIYRQGRPAEALEALARGERSLDPEEDLVRGACLAATGRLDLAEEALRRCLRRRPDWLEPRYKLGQVLQKAGKAEDGRRELERAARLSRLVLEIERLEGLGEEYFEERFEADTERTELRRLGLQLGRALLEALRFADAERNVGQTLRLLPGDEELVFLLGLALHGQGRSDEALRVLRAGLEKSPGSDALAGAIQAIELAPAAAPGDPDAVGVIEDLLGVAPR